MGRRTVLIRIRFPHDVVERLDRLAERLRVDLGRRVPRAALVRALVQLHMDAVEDRQDLIDVLGADPVKRGRESTRRGEPRGDDGLPGRRGAGASTARCCSSGRLSNEEGNSL
jgi:hypothetical protein